MSKEIAFITALSGLPPSPLTAADLLLELTSEAKEVSAEVTSPEEISLRVRGGAVNSYPVRDGKALFRMVLARIGTICLHAPTLEWKPMPLDQLPRAFLELDSYLINVEHDKPRYFRTTIKQEKMTLYGGEAELLVCTTQGTEAFLNIQFTNRTHIQRFRGMVVAPPFNE